MQITVHYLAQLKRLAGQASEAVDIDPDATLADLIHELVERHAELASATSTPGGQVHDSLLVFLGEEQARGSFPRPLREGDHITLMTPMAGGQTQSFVSQKCV